MSQNEQREPIPEGCIFSDLSAEELKSIREAEEQVNRQHNNKLYLIAYDKMTETEKGS